MMLQAGDHRYDAFMALFYSEVFQRSFAQVQQFFSAVAKTCHIAFTIKDEAGRVISPFVTVWANNHHSKLLIYQTSHPLHDELFDRLAMEQDEYITGRAIVENDVVVSRDMDSPLDGRRVANPKVVASLGVMYVVSIPIPSSYNPQLIHFVVNVSYPVDGLAIKEDYDREIRWLRRSLCLYLDGLLFRINHFIRSTVSKHIPTATGIARLLFDIQEPILSMTESTSLALYRWNRSSALPELEYPTGHLEETLNVPSNMASINEKWRRIIRQCVGLRNACIQPLPNYNVGAQVATSSIHTLGFDICIPVLSLSTEGEVLALLRCVRLANGPSVRPYSSHDIHVLEQYALAIAPYMEKFILSHTSDVLVPIMQEVYRVVNHTPENIENILNTAIDAFVNSVHARTGSIYLVELDQSGNSLLRLAAATPALRQGVGTWTYRIGEGLTGFIASNGGNRLIFRTRSERHVHPSYLNMYRTEPDTLDERAQYAFLGLPIISENRVIGIWKAEDVQSSPTQHPEAYFTEDDIRTADILTLFLAYVIANYQTKGLALSKFRLLAKYCAAIQSAQNEDQAVNEVMLAFQQAGWSQAMYSRYDEGSRMIIGHKSIGDSFERIRQRTKRPINCNDLLPAILNSNVAEFIPDSRDDDRCDQKAVSEVGRIAQFVMPLRIVDGHQVLMIGTLQVDMGNATSIADDDELLLKAFAEHLTIAIARFRIDEKLTNLTKKIMDSAGDLTTNVLISSKIHNLRARFNNVRSMLPNEPNLAAGSHRDSITTTLLQISEELDSILRLGTPGRAKLPREPLNLKDELPKCVNEWYHYAKRIGCLLEVVPHIHNVVVKMARADFEAACAIVIVNAVQAGATSLKVRVTVGRNARITVPGQVVFNAARITWRDNGSGVNKTDRYRIFDWGYTTKDQASGTGLGLPLARALARDVGGDLMYVNETRSMGATFRLVLPRYVDV